MFNLGVQRVLDPQVVENEGRYYVRIRDIAWILGIKQPFEFTSHIKKTLGDEVILKGDDTEYIRTEEDKVNTVFIELGDLYKHLQYNIQEHKIIQSQKQALLRRIEELCEVA